MDNLSIIKSYVGDLLGCCMKAVAPLAKVIACTVCVGEVITLAVGMETEPKFTPIPSSLEWISD